MVLRNLKMERGYVYVIQILLVAGIALGSQSIHLNDKQKWALSIARYIMYILTMHATELVSVVIHEVIQKKRDFNTQLFTKVSMNQLLMYVASVTVLFYNEEKLYSEDFLLICIAYLIIKYPMLITLGKATLSIGVGLAASYVEGYLMYIIPPAEDGMESFEDKMRKYESVHNVVVPVKKLFIIITKSMYSPADLNEFNKKSQREDVSRLEPCSSFDEVVKDVAGVKNRIYKSAVYKISRLSAPPVRVAAECATPLYTLYKAIQNKHVYNDIIDVSAEDVVFDFMSTLRMILAKNPQLKDKCEIVFFDDTNESLNLADVLLDRIKELEPNFEQLINSKN
ncbi:unnamed protein product [Arctia plantaginis]|uniref:STING ligand-binding domain-containing protein n=1 Tax=Arctia plantaginis TaxID=874455 RepID=A0A8S0ZBW9_ARCPL|nr:unnamed protein product [Arctia plantaginis]